MFRIPRMTFAMAVLALATQRVGATSLLNVGPLAEADAVSVQEPFIGNTLAITPTEATPLFGFDRARFDRFKAALVTALSDRLKAGGLAVNSRSGYALGVSVFGGTFMRAECPTRVFYSVEVWISSPGDSHASKERVVLGVSEDRNLESGIIAAASSVVDEFLEDRAIYRSSKKKGGGP